MQQVMVIVRLFPEVTIMYYSVLEVGRYDTVCHTGTSLDGYKSYRHFPGRV